MQVRGKRCELTRVEHELDIGCVGGAGLVAVNLLRGRPVFRLELRLDVSRTLVVRLLPCIGQWNVCKVVNTVMYCTVEMPSLLKTNRQ